MAQLTILERIAEKAVEANVKTTVESAQWFYNRVREIRFTDPRKLLRERVAVLHERDVRGRLRFLGRMFSFFYEPKTKATLSYYDRFPLVIPIRESGQSFWGLNLHYLSPRMRMLFLKQLAPFLVNPRGNLASQQATEEDSLNPYDSTTRLRFTSWNVLHKSRLARFARPAIKRYERSHIRSRILEFTPQEWVMIAFLPTARFVGARPGQVWDDSKAVSAALGRGTF